MNWLIRGVALASGLLSSGPFTAAQTESSLAIRVESNQVLVPTFVFDKQRLDGMGTPAEERCIKENMKALQEEGISVRQLPANCWGGSPRDLALKDFRLFEDGAEQTVQSVTPQREHWWQLYDNRGLHREYSSTPRGVWSTADLGSSLWAPPTDVGSYVITYAPPQSAEGSCHRIKISVDRRNVVVYNRSEYCNVHHSVSDPLEGTKFGQQMETDLAASTKPKITILATSGIFFTDSGAMRAHLVLEFPWNSLHREWISGYDHVFASIGVLGMEYGKDGTLVARFSDQACCPRDTPFGDFSYREAGDEIYLIPARYETQIDLPPGDYDLRVILSDGKKFGRLDIPLSIERTDKELLNLSSVALCKRYHRIDPPSYTEGILPSKFVPLVSKGVEFTPAADTAFTKRDPLFAYFEIYAPSQVGAGAGATNAPSHASAAAAGATSASKSPPEPQLRAARNAVGVASAPTSQIEHKPSGAGNTAVHFQLKITNPKTGEVQIDSGLRPATEFLQEGKPVIHIVQEVATHDLPKGNYRLEVQATDSSGHRTPWHAATFTIR